MIVVAALVFGILIPIYFFFSSRFILFRKLFKGIFIFALPALWNGMYWYLKLKVKWLYCYIFKPCMWAKQLDFKTYSVTYLLEIDGHVEEYEIFLRLPEKYKTYVVMDEEVKVTDELKRYLGPNKDWHESIITPYLLGFDKLTIMNSDGVVTKVDHDLLING